MAGDHDHPADPGFGNKVAKYTFIATMIFAVLFIGVVFLFIL